MPLRNHESLFNFNRKNFFLSGFPHNQKIRFLFLSSIVHLLLIFIGFGLDTDFKVDKYIELEIYTTKKDIGKSGTLKTNNNTETKSAIRKQNIKKDLVSNANMKPELEAMSIEYKSINRKNTEQPKIPAKPNEFLNTYEETLFTRSTEKNKNIYSSGIAEWKEFDSKIAADDKTKTFEKIQYPAKTSSILWKEGSNRKIISLPEIEYPLLYRKKGIQGKVLLAIEVNGAGNIVSIDILRSSGYPKLDIVARKAISKAVFNEKPSMTENAIDQGEIEVKFELGK
jgi:TonB family protein